MLGHSCDPRMNPAWLWCMIFCTCLWIRFGNVSVRIFFIQIIKYIGLNFLYWWCLFSYFGIGGSTECFWACALLFSLWDEFKKDQCKLFFACLVSFDCEAIWSWNFVGFFFFYRFYFVCSDQCVQIGLFFKFSFRRLYFLETCPFLLVCPVLLACSILWWFIVFS